MVKEESYRLGKELKSAKLLSCLATKEFGSAKKELESAEKEFGLAKLLS
ncbi:hypothetical protein [Candidatus Electronema sp. PJ]